MSVTLPSEFKLTLPEWVHADLARAATHYPDRDQRMQLCLSLSQKNFEQDTGGPFAAAVFEVETGKLIAVGVNRVVPSRCSSAHAEVMALSLAQQALGSFDLAGNAGRSHELVVNWRPCAMCCGAVVWSGVQSLVIAGSGPELERYTGFDEGPIHPQWEAELARRGIAVTDGVLRDHACAIFKAFGSSGRLVYNASRG